MDVTIFLSSKMMIAYILIIIIKQEMKSVCTAVLLVLAIQLQVSNQVNDKKSSLRSNSGKTQSINNFDLLSKNDIFKGKQFQVITSDDFDYILIATFYNDGRMLVFGCDRSIVNYQTDQSSFKVDPESWRVDKTFCFDDKDGIIRSSFNKVTQFQVESDGIINFKDNSGTSRIKLHPMQNE